MVKKNPAVVKAALSNSPEFDKLLTSRSVNSCTQTDGDVPKKSSLLHILVNQNDDSRVNLVIRKGIDVNLQNARGNTALIQALQTPHVAASIVQSLIHAPNMDYDLPNSVRYLHVGCDAYIFLTMPCCVVFSARENGTSCRHRDQ